MIDIHPEHARTILAQLGVGVILVDRKEQVNWVNPYAANLLGVNPETLLGRSIDELALPYCELKPGDDLKVSADGALIGITQRYQQPLAEGALLMLFDRGHSLVWFLSALSSGLPGTIAASGIFTRATTVARLEAEVSRSRRYANPLSCITVSAPGANAPTVAEIARTLKGQLRWVDLLGQWSEDTLLVVLPETDEEATTGLAGKLEFAMKHDHAKRAPGLQVGQASWRRGDSAEQLVTRALGGISLDSQVLPFSRQAPPS